MAEAAKTATKATETEKLIKIRIPRSRDNQDDVFVGVNGRTWLIKRGVEVEVPECVAEVIRNAEEAEEAAYAFNDSVKK
jgi:hypothetical protein